MSNRFLNMSRAISRGPMAVCAAIAFCAGLLCATPANALDAGPAAEPGDVQQVIDQASALHSAVQSYTFGVRLHIIVHTFPWVRFRLKGDGQYQKGGPYVLDIRNMPGFAKSYGHVSLAYLDPQTWSKQYEMTVAERTADTAVLVLHDRQKSPLIDARATFETKRGLRQIVWRYSYGGVVRLTFTPNEKVGYALPGTMDADITMPQYHATAHADFVDYRIVADAEPAMPPAGHEPNTTAVNGPR